MKKIGAIATADDKSDWLLSKCRNMNHDKTEKFSV